MHFQTGFTLLEVLISLLILSIALLGLDAMQLTTLTHIKNTYSYAVANQQLNTLTAQLAVWKKDQLPAQLARWNAQNANALILGKGTLTENQSQLTITVSWGDQNPTCINNKIGSTGCLQTTFNIASEAPH